MISFTNLLAKVTYKSKFALVEGFLWSNNAINAKKIFKSHHWWCLGKTSRNTSLWHIMCVVLCYTTIVHSRWVERHSKIFHGGTILGSLLLSGNLKDYQKWDVLLIWVDRDSSWKWSWGHLVVGVKDIWAKEEGFWTNQGWDITFFTLNVQM